MAGIPKARLESVFSSTSRSRQVQNFHPSYLDNLNFMAGFEIEDSQDIASPARLSFRSSISNPKGRIRCKAAPVAAQVRAMLPVFWGIPAREEQC